MTEEKRTVMKYSIVKEPTLQDCVNSVQIALDAGYMPLGGCQYAVGYWMQTLVIEEEYQDNEVVAGESH